MKIEGTQFTSSDVGQENETSQTNVLQVHKVSVRLTSIFTKIRGSSLLIIGYLLSPLSWWNDLFFNMPIAYGFGYICSFFDASLLVPCSIVGYWISNVLGILMMQAGVVDVFQNQKGERNLKKELLTGLVSSSIYTVIICGLLYFKIIDVPNLFP